MYSTTYDDAAVICIRLWNAERTQTVQIYLMRNRELTPAEAAAAPTVCTPSEFGRVCLAMERVGLTYHLVRESDPRERIVQKLVAEMGVPHAIRS